jgi:hypothetical protein
MKKEKTKMEAQKINWLELSDIQKAIVLKQAKTYLQQQIAESKLGESVTRVLRKHELLE